MTGGGVFREWLQLDRTPFTKYKSMIIFSFINSMHGMDKATATSVLAGFATRLNLVAAPPRQRLTYNQGKEMARHAKLTASTGLRSNSAIRMAPGSTAPAKTPMSFCAWTS
jgi:hypothetical protein